MPLQFTFYIADAFVDPGKAFSGNPAAVVILSKDSDISDHAKQNIATEFNLSATVFVSKIHSKLDSKLEDEDRFLIRWFTPICEIELCGHATMAASYLLFTQQNEYNELIGKSRHIKYQTQFKLKQTLEASYDGQYVTLNFPSNSPVPIDSTRCKWITSLQKTIVNDESESFLDAQLGPNHYLLLRLRDNIDIKALKPNFDQMLAVDTGGSVILAIVTQKADFDQTGAHFTARVFGPWDCMNEDPVCGSAFTLMTPYWERVFREQQQNGLLENCAQENSGFFHAKQMSSRGGLILNKMGSNNRVIFGGQVKLFSKGQFSVCD